MSNIIVWSKNNCVYCSMAKNFLDQLGLTYEERNIESGAYTIDDLQKLAPRARTMPQVFSGKFHVGGYDDVVQHFSAGNELGGLSL